MLKMGTVNLRGIIDRFPYWSLIRENKVTALVLLDLSKAFDSVDHDHLLHKLHKVGISAYFCSMYDHVTPVLKQLKWLPYIKFCISGTV